ncbi:MAG: T9SS type A sorting domain-containing protein [Bacteroidota bacterium]
MNGDGAIGLAYSVTGPSLFPSIRFTGQTAAASGSGQMDVEETTILDGGGVQTLGFGRWGDYSMTSVDPVDDRTFWHTNEYYETTSARDYRTRIASFELPSGGLALSATNTTPLTVAPGDSVTFAYTISNATDSDLAGDLFFEMTPAGLAGIITSGVIPAGQSTSGTFTQPVPDTTLVGTYAYTISVGQFPDVSRASRTFTLAVVGATATESQTAPDAVLLGAAYPNPFRAAATFSFALPVPDDLTLEVLDVLGRRVALLAEGTHAAGAHRATFDATGLPSGAYVVRLVTGSGQSEVQRLTLLR